MRRQACGGVLGCAVSKQKELEMFFPVPRMLHIGTQHIQKGSVYSFHQAISHGVVGCNARLNDLEGLAEICKNLTFKVTALI